MIIQLFPDYDTHETVTCTSHYIYDADRQRSLQHFLRIESLPARFTQVELPSGTYAACGIQVRLQRKQMQFLVQVYLPSFMFVVTSWVSFLIKPEVVPGRLVWFYFQNEVSIYSFPEWDYWLLSSLF